MRLRSKKVLKMATESSDASLTNTLCTATVTDKEPESELPSMHGNIKESEMLHESESEGFISIVSEPVNRDEPHVLSGNSEPSVTQSENNIVEPNLGSPDLLSQVTNMISQMTQKLTAHMTQQLTAQMTQINTQLTEQSRQLIDTVQQYRSEITQEIQELDARVMRQITVSEGVLSGQVDSVRSQVQTIEGVTVQLQSEMDSLRQRVIEQENVRNVQPTTCSTFPITGNNPSVPSTVNDPLPSNNPLTPSASTDPTPALTNPEPPSVSCSDINQLASSNQSYILSNNDLPLPVFENSQRTNPVRYLNELKTYFRLRNVPEHLQMILVSRSLTGSASRWFNVINDSTPLDMLSFEKAFLNEFWSQSDQERLRYQIFHGRYDKSCGMNFVEYFMSLCDNKQLLIPQINEREFVEAMCLQYTGSIRHSLIIASPQTINEMLRLLKSLCEPQNHPARVGLNQIQGTNNRRQVNCMQTAPENFSSEVRSGGSSQAQARGNSVHVGEQMEINDCELQQGPRRNNAASNWHNYRYRRVDRGTNWNRRDYYRNQNSRENLGYSSYNANQSYRGQTNRNGPPFYQRGNVSNFRAANPPWYYRRQYNRDFFHPRIRGQVINNRYVRNRTWNRRENTRTPQNNIGRGDIVETAPTNRPQSPELVQ